jgi:protein TonB
MDRITRTLAMAAVLLLSACAAPSPLPSGVGQPVWAPRPPDFGERTAEETRKRPAVCSHVADSMKAAGFPREAAQAGLTYGRVVVQFTLRADGQIANVSVLESTDPIFARASVDIVSQYRCTGQGRDVEVRVPFTYTLR